MSFNKQQDINVLDDKFEGEKNPFTDSFVMALMSKLDSKIKKWQLLSIFASGS